MELHAIEIPGGIIFSRNYCFKKPFSIWYTSPTAYSILMRRNKIRISRLFLFRFLRRISNTFPGEFQNNRFTVEKPLKLPKSLESLFFSIRGVPSNRQLRGRESNFLLPIIYLKSVLRAVYKAREGKGEQQECAESAVSRGWGVRRESTREGNSLGGRRSRHFVLLNLYRWHGPLIPTT